MIIDALKVVPDRTILASDVCIVGSGPAGVTLALELISSGLQVVLLEAGGRRFSSTSQDFYRGEIVGRNTNELLERYRYRQLGGTSTAWGGRCLLFDDIDFAHRDYIAESGWPFGRDELLPYYDRALVWCEADPRSYDAREVLPDETPEIVPGLPDGDVVTTSLERWSPPTDFGSKYRTELKSAPNLRVLLNAACVAINLDEDHKSVASLKVRSGPSKTFEVKSRFFLLAVGGLEVPRLLLSSNHQVPEGIGNRHDLVGRYYMTHLSGVLSTAYLSVDPSQVANGYKKDRNGIYVRRRISISEEAQRREHLPNITIQFHYPPVTDPKHRNAILSTLFVAKHIQTIRRGIPPGLGITETQGFSETADLWLKHLTNMVIDAPNLMSFLPKFVFERFLRRRRIPSVVLPTKLPVFPLHYHAEQTPNRDSRVILSNDRDFYGIPRLALHFHVNRFDIEGVVRAHEVLDRHFRKSGIGRVEFDQRAIDKLQGGGHATNGHFVGTTKMATQPKNGVVDPDCRVFGVENLYVASSSVFPTSSHANPTLTIVAMAIRLAEQVRKLAGTGVR
jgi:choline dehydrogenase-like flavoprotein